MRFTIKWLFLAVAMLALACAGLMYRTMVWAEIIFAISLLLFSSQFIRAVFAKPAERAGNIAFAVVGISYLLLVTSPLLDRGRLSAELDELKNGVDPFADSPIPSTPLPPP